MGVERLKTFIEEHGLARTTLFPLRASSGGCSTSPPSSSPAEGSSGTTGMTSTSTCNKGGGDVRRSRAIVDTLSMSFAISAYASVLSAKVGGFGPSHHRSRGANRNGNGAGAVAHSAAAALRFPMVASPIHPDAGIMGAEASVLREATRNVLFNMRDVMLMDLVLVSDAPIVRREGLASEADASRQQEKARRAREKEKRVRQHFEYALANEEDGARDTCCTDGGSAVAQRKRIFHDHSTLPRNFRLLIDRFIAAIICEEEAAKIEEERERMAAADTAASPSLSPPSPSPPRSPFITIVTLVEGEADHMIGQLVKDYAADVVITADTDLIVAEHPALIALTEWIPWKVLTARPPPTTTTNKRIALQTVRHDDLRRAVGLTSAARGACCCSEGEGSSAGDAGALLAALLSYGGRAEAAGHSDGGGVVSSATCSSSGDNRCDARADTLLLYMAAGLCSNDTTHTVFAGAVTPWGRLPTAIYELCGAERRRREGGGGGDDDGGDTSYEQPPVEVLLERLLSYACCTSSLAASPPTLLAAAKVSPYDVAAALTWALNALAVRLAGAGVGAAEDGSVAPPSASAVVSPLTLGAGHRRTIKDIVEVLVTVRRAALGELTVHGLGPSVVPPLLQQVGPADLAQTFPHLSLLHLLLTFPQMKLSMALYVKSSSFAIDAAAPRYLARSGGVVGPAAPTSPSMTRIPRLSPSQFPHFTSHREDDLALFYGLHLAGQFPCFARLIQGEGEGEGEGGAPITVDPYRAALACMPRAPTSGSSRVVDGAPASSSSSSPTCLLSLSSTPLVPFKQLPTVRRLDGEVLGGLLEAQRRRCGYDSSLAPPAAQTTDCGGGATDGGEGGSCGRQGGVVARHTLREALSMPKQHRRQIIANVMGGTAAGVGAGPPEHPYPYYYHSGVDAVDAALSPTTTTCEYGGSDEEPDAIKKRRQKAADTAPALGSGACTNGTSTCPFPSFEAAVLWVLGPALADREEAEVVAAFLIALGVGDGLVAAPSADAKGEGPHHCHQAEPQRQQKKKHRGHALLLKRLATYAGDGFSYDASDPIHRVPTGRELVLGYLIADAFALLNDVSAALGFADFSRVGAAVVMAPPMAGSSDGCGAAPITVIDGSDESLFDSCCCPSSAIGGGGGPGAVVASYSGSLLHYLYCRKGHALRQLVASMTMAMPPSLAEGSHGAQGATPTTPKAVFEALVGKGGL